MQTIFAKCIMNGINMMTKNIADYQEMKSFVEELLNSKKYYCAVDQVSDGYQVKWIEIKNYVSQDGQEFPDEVWETKEGELVLIQDISEDHAKNIIRMIIRNQRNMMKSLEPIMAEIAQQISNQSDDDFEPERSPNIVLH